MKKITIKDVAREAGVSVTLVSFVMNAKVGEDGRLDCPVNPETAARVLEVAKRLGYRRNAAAASLRSGRSNTIAVITTDIANNYFAGISRYIEDKSAQYGYTVQNVTDDLHANGPVGIMTGYEEKFYGHLQGHRRPCARGPAGPRHRGSGRCGQGPAE